MILTLEAALADVLTAVDGEDDHDAITAILAAIDTAFARHLGFGAFAGTAAPSVHSQEYTLYLTGVPARGQQTGWASTVPLTTWGTTGLMQTTTGTSGTDRLLLPIWPVSAIASVHDDAEWEWGEDTEVSSDDYILFRDVWALRKKPSADLWSTTERAIQIVLTAGYEEIPDECA